jgi:nitroreductase
MIDVDNNELKKAIHRSQHCQRNWDLSKEIPEEDMDLIITAATQCPSKQNIAHYKVHAITNRDLIEKIHQNTVGFQVVHTNSQVLANLLLVFEYKSVDAHKNLFSYNQEISQSDKANSFLRDAHMAVGVAAGYVNVISSIIGYNTGCCACFNGSAIKELLGLNGDVLLMMGVGFKDPNLNRRIHHENHDFTFPAIKKEEISVKYHK